jgi:hypothetical protein
LLKTPKLLWHRIHRDGRIVRRTLDRQLIRPTQKLPSIDIDHKPPSANDTRSL